MSPTVITEVVNRDLCIGCGICAALCPQELLEIRWNKYGEYTPIEKKACEKECGLCLKVCPFVDNKDNEDTIGQKFYGPLSGIMHKPETGYYLSAYAGYADEEYRSKSASGGIATWLLERLLEDKVVDHVVCVIPNEDPEKLFSFKVFNSPGDVRRGAGSAYYPVEMSMVIKHVLETPGKYAIIGLPCFIKAIRLAQIHNKKLNDRILISTGLVCGQLKSKYFTDYIAALAGVKGKVISVRCRCKSPDRPASDFYYSFTDDKGEKKSIFWTGGISQAWVNRWFTPKACNYCDDIFAECADVVCMDAWLPEYSQDSRGTSLLLVRSPIIMDIIDKYIHSQEIILDSIPIDKVILSQKEMIIIKRQHLAYRLYHEQQNGQKVPQKRVIPIRLAKPLQRHEIFLKERMQILSRDLMDPKEPNLERFIKEVQPYLIRMKLNDIALKIIRFVYSN